MDLNPVCWILQSATPPYTGTLRVDLWGPFITRVFNEGLLGDIQMAHSWIAHYLPSSLLKYWMSTTSFNVYIHPRREVLP